MENSRQQAEFYDKNPPFVPWPYLLSKYGLKRLYKPREIFWKKALDSLKIKKNQSILEVGCGQGLFLSRIYDTFKIKATGIDISPKSIRYANNNYKKKNLNFFSGNASKLPFKTASFDFTLSFDVLEHIKEQEKAMLEMARVTKPGGKILIYSLNKDDRFTLDWIWEKFGLDIYKRAAHTRDLFIDVEFIKKSFVRQNCKIVYFRLFDAFFTLFLDELIMINLIFFKKIGLFGNKTFGRIFLNIFSSISMFFYPILNRLDEFWYSKGKSMSFIIIAEK